jgi:N-acyl-D-amino-acid deacylase
MRHDLLIKTETVLDGAGAVPRQADVAVAVGKIAEIGRITDRAKPVIDAADCVVSPGYMSQARPGERSITSE